MRFINTCLLATSLLANSLIAFANANDTHPAPLVSIPTHDAFFDKLAAHCGKSFAGAVVFDNDPSPAFDAPLIMHIRHCTEQQLQIPFHVGDDASRT